MKFAKVRNVKSPLRSTELSAGYDFFIPFDVPIATLLPHEDINIPSGVHVKVPDGYALVVFNKSGRAVNDGLSVGACVIDADYQGEVHLHVRNTSKSQVTLLPGTKLVQMLLLKISNEEVEEVNLDDLYENESERGSGGFGSTGLN